MKDSNQTAHLLCHVAFLLQAQQDQILQEQLGIGFAQYKILLSLSNRTTSSQLNVAKELGQTEASISRQVKLLSKNNLINVQVDPTNRRQHLLDLTSTGSRLLEAAQLAIARFNSKSIKLTDKQTTQLYQLLSLIVE